MTLPTVVERSAPESGAAELPVAARAESAARDDLRQRLRWSWRVLWRSKHLVLACLLPVMVPTFLYLQQVTPRYTAEARIMIEAPEVRSGLDERSPGRPWLSEQVVQTEADLLSSTVLAHRAIEKLGLREDPEFNGRLREPKPLAVFLSWLNPLSWLPESRNRGEAAELPPEVRERMELAAVTRAFTSRATVRVQRRSFVVSVLYTSESREKAALIANTLTELYVLDRLEASFEEARRVSDWLGQRLESLRRDVAVADTATEEYRAIHGLRRKSEQAVPLKDQQTSELMSRMVLARADLAQKQARLGQLRALQQSRGSFDATSEVLQSPLIQHLREQESQRQREMSDALKTYGERHPRILGNRADLAELRGKIAQEIEKISAALANEVEVGATGLRALEKEMEKARQQSNTAGEAEIRLRELERQGDASRAVYEAFLARFKREAENTRVQRANARVVSPADIPVAPSYPARNSTLGMAFLIALAGGIALVFLIDRLDNAVRSADEAELLTELPTLAMVPLLRGQTARPADEILQRPRSTLADAVRSLRTALDLGSGGERRQVLLVTSSVPREGKTFVSLCLALLFAKTYPRVLVIDADVHRPNMFRIIGVEGDRGLVQVLNGEVAPEEVIQHGVLGVLDFLPAGISPNVAEVITGPRMEALIATLAPLYDRIIIDSPPVLAVTDTRVLARLVDRVVYLIKWNATPRDAVRNGMKLLRGAGGALFGVALTQVNQRKHDRYGYGDYGFYYGRYRDYYGE